MPIVLHPTNTAELVGILGVTVNPDITWIPICTRAHKSAFQYQVIPELHNIVS